MREQLESTLPGRLLGYIASIVMVGLVTGLIGLSMARVNVGNISMLYLTAVLASGVFFGRGPSVFAALSSFLVFNWFFIEPVHTLTVADPDQWVALILFLLTAVVTSELATKLRQRARQAERREREAEVLYDIGRSLAEADLEQALSAVAGRLRAELGVLAVSIDLAYSRDDENSRQPVRMAVAGDAGSIPSPNMVAPGSLELLVGDIAPSGHAGAGAGRWVRIIQPQSSRTDRRIGSAQLHVVKVVSAGQTVGMVSVARAQHAPELTQADSRLLSAVASQVGLALERRRLRQRANEAEVLARTDELKTALIHAVSHDLKTPLVSILASAGALLQEGVDWSEAERRDLVRAIEQEVKRLNQIVGNLLDLSRIEAGAVQLDKGWYDLGVLVDEVLGRLRPLTREHRVAVRIPEDLPPVPLGYTEIDQVLTNLIENALKYAPRGTEILISARMLRDEVEVEVADQGPGIPAAEISRVFEPFYRVSQKPAGPAGTGVGLAVAKGMVEAHGGRIRAENRRDGGARFIFTLPLDRELRGTKRTSGGSG